MIKYVLPAAAVAALMSFAGPVSAQNSATVIEEFGCNLIAPDWGGSINLYTDETTHFVETSSGNWNLQCHFDIPAGYEPLKAAKTEGFLCVFSRASGVTETFDSQAIATPGGKATLTCNVNGR